MRKDILIVAAINVLGIIAYFMIKFFLKPQNSFGLLYFFVVSILSILIYTSFKYLDYYRINKRLRDFQQNLKTGGKMSDLFFNSSVKLAAWIVLVVFVMLPSLKLVHAGILEQGGEIVIEKNTVINVPFKVEFTQIVNLAKEYGLDTGIILAMKDKEAELLLFNFEIQNREDLVAKRIRIDENNEIFYQENAYLPEDLIGYSLTLIRGNASSYAHLLGYRSKIDTASKKLYSDLLIMDKEFPSIALNLLQQSYVLDYDPSTGMVPQDNIPAIISFTIDIIGDYIIYQDVDLFWKIQNIKTGEIYTSNEDNDNTYEIVPVYMMRGDYISILQYKADEKFLLFNTVSKEFVVK